MKGHIQGQQLVVFLFNFDNQTLFEGVFTNRNNVYGVWVHTLLYWSLQVTAR